MGKKRKKVPTTKRNCDNCGEEYEADNRNLKRGWGLCCSKSCAASKREKDSKVAYTGEDPEEWHDEHFSC